MNNNIEALHPNATLLDKVLFTEQFLRARSRSEIVYSLPLITRSGIPIIMRGTINVIQGKQGSHKSRLAELFASLMMGTDECNATQLGFESIDNEAVTVVYIDTERSINEEFPAAIQCMKVNAGFDFNAEVSNFRYTSLKVVDRSARLEALRAFILRIRQETPHPIFLVIDVATDGVKNFNDPEESMKLLDFLGRLCDQTDSTVLLVIHENPASDKMRGHLGTEALNKAATVMQIGFEKASDEQGAPYLSLKFVKQRHSERLKPIPLLVDTETKSLKLANQSAYDTALQERDKKVTAGQIVPLLSKLQGNEYKQQAMVTMIRDEFGCSVNTAKARLDEIAEQHMEIVGDGCAPCILKIKVSNGKPTIYELVNQLAAS